MAASTDDDGAADPADPADLDAGFDAEASWAERLADARIVAKLRECGYDGPEWQVLADALMAYGYSVLSIWGASGMLACHAAEHGGVSGRRVPPGLRLDADQAHALAAEVVITAVDRFRTHSLPHWTLEGGATLRSWFIGRCLMELADVHARWRAREVRPLPVEAITVDDGRHGPRPDEQAEARVLLDQLLRVDPDLCRAVRMQEAGYDLTTIARVLGTTPAGARSRMYRSRRALRARFEAETTETTETTEATDAADAAGPTEQEEA